METQEYSKAEIRFWSGTGNSHKVACWLQDSFQKQGVESDLLAMDKKIKSSLQGDVLIMVYPTHGFTAPWHVLRYAWSLRNMGRRDVYCVSTRAGLKIGRFFPPGLTGSAGFLVALLLLLGGFRVKGCASIDMPSNWFSLHPIQKGKSLQAIIDRNNKKARTLFKKIHNKKLLWLTFNNLYEFTAGLLLLPISCLYLFMGRFFLAKLFFANNKCDGCGICEKQCPIKAISMVGKKSKRPYWRITCESCMGCAAICPKQAVEAGQSWGVLLYFLTCYTTFYFLFSRFVPLASAAEGRGFIEIFLWLVYIYPIIFISYLIFYLLVRIPVMNVIFTYTTFTALPLWGRYKIPGLNWKELRESKGGKK